MAEEIKGVETESQLHKLVAKYVRLSRKLEKAQADMDRDKAPLKPEQFLSLEEMREFGKDLEERNAQKSELATKRATLNEKRDKVGSVIAATLPVSTAWVKVGGFAVGKYWNARKRIGNFWDIEIEVWGEKLPPLYDRSC